MSQRILPESTHIQVESGIAAIHNRYYTYAVMARPKLPPEERRDRLVPARISKVEQEAIKEAADVAGYKNISEAIRDVLLKWSRRTIKAGKRRES